MDDVLDNFVRVRLAQDFTDADTEFRVQEPVAPYQLPPAPAGGEQGRVTFMTDFYAPQAFEIVTYTGRTDNGDGTYTFTGITRGAEGTTVPSVWKAGAEVIQQPTAGLPRLSRWPSWTEVSAKPSTFPPDAHGHDWSEIANIPAEATRWPDWTEVTGKPATFPPSAHGHDWSELSSIPAYATRWPTWDEVTSKPSTFPPTAHNHVLADISDAGSMAGQDAASVAITGGTITGLSDGITLTRAGGTFFSGITIINTSTGTNADAAFRLQGESGTWDFRTTAGGERFAATLVGSAGAEFEVRQGSAAQGDYKKAGLYLGVTKFAIQEGLFTSTFLVTDISNSGGANGTGRIDCTVGGTARTLSFDP